MSKGEDHVVLAKNMQAQQFHQELALLERCIQHEQIGKSIPLFSRTPAARSAPGPSGELAGIALGANDPQAIRRHGKHDGAVSAEAEGYALAHLEAVELYCV